jgi:uncharacterized protein (TIGR00251 family)
MARKIWVTVKPNARQTSVSKVSDTEYRVAVHAPAQDGKANQALIEALAEYLAIPKSAVRIARGHSSRKKLIELD